MVFEKLKAYKSWITSGAIAGAIALWLLSGQTAVDDSAPPTATMTATDAPERSSVRVRQQTAEVITREIVVNGRTAPARIVELNAETDGRVTAVGALRGERVDEDGIIVRLDRRDRAARLAQAKATVRQRELEYEARTELQGESYVSEAQLQQAAADLEAARAELTRAELDIGYATIRAPFDGALQERHVEVGDFVKQGDPIATFVDERTLIVSADISEFDAHAVTKGSPASAELATGEAVRGTIRYVAPVADEATRTFRVELEVDNGDGTLRAGMTAKLSIPAERVFAHKISPSLLTLDEEGNLGVKIINEAGVVEFFPADIAMSSSEGMWIAGLPHAATIITVGQGFVNAGATVAAVPEEDIDTAVAIKAGETTTRK